MTTITLIAIFALGAIVALIIHDKEKENKRKNAHFEKKIKHIFDSAAIQLEADIKYMQSVEKDKVNERKG